MGERQDEQIGSLGGEAPGERPDGHPASKTSPPIRLTDWWIYRRVRYPSIQVRVALVLLVCFGVGGFLRFSDLISTGDSQHDVFLKKLSMSVGLIAGICASVALGIWYRRKMIAADERLCQRCFTPHEARGVMTCGTCGHFFHGDEDRAEHMYAAFRDYAGRVGSVPFWVVVILLVCEQVFGAFGVKLESLTGVHLVYIIVGSQVCAIAITASVKKRRDDRVRRANFCCCERCGHPFDWQVSEEQLKSYDSDKQPPELITCTECGETFSPLAVYRRWRHALN